MLNFLATAVVILVVVVVVRNMLDAVAADLYERTFRKLVEEGLRVRMYEF